MPDDNEGAVLSIPEALSRLQQFKEARDKARDDADAAQDRMIDAAKDARRAGVAVARIGAEVGLSRQQTHRLLGDVQTVDGAP